MSELTKAEREESNKRALVRDMGSQFISYLQNYLIARHDYTLLKDYFAYRTVILRLTLDKNNNLNVEAIPIKLEEVKTNE